MSIVYDCRVQNAERVCSEDIRLPCKTLCSSYLKDSLITLQGKKAGGWGGEKKENVRKKVGEKEREREYPALLAIANLWVGEGGEEF